MKKPSRSASKKPAKKPVTIELKAESAESKKNAEASSRSSVPRTSKTRTSTKSTRSQSTATADAKSSASDSTSKKTVFGRGEAISSTSDSKESKSAKPEASKESPPASKISDNATHPKTGPEAKSGSGLGLFSAALLGGLVTLVGAGALQYAGILGSPGSGNSVSQTSFTQLKNEVTGKFTALESSVGEISSRPNSSLDEKRVEALITTKLAETQQTPEIASTDLDAVTTQVNETTLRVETLQSEISALSTKLDTLSSAVSSGEAGDNAGLANLTTRLDGVGSKLEELSSEMTSLKAETLEIASRPAPEPVGLSETIASITTLKAALPALKSNLNNELGQLKTELSSLKAVTEKQSSNLNTIEGKVANSEAVKKQAASAISAAALKSDIDRGIPFAASLKTLEDIAGSTENLVKLKKYADTGVPTVSQLSSGFESVGPEIISALTPKPKNDLASRLAAGAKAFVSVKPVGPVKGDTPIALVSRIGQALESGKLTEAAELWTALPEDGKAVSTDWHNSLQARISTNSLISSTVQSFVQSSVTQ